MIQVSIKGVASLEIQVESLNDLGIHWGYISLDIKVCYLNDSGTH